MKKILELSEEDIHAVFQDCWKAEMIKIHQLESMHFRDDARMYWNTFNEHYFISNNRIRK